MNNEKYGMSLADAMTEKYVAVQICGLPGIYTAEQIDGSTIPDGLFAYLIESTEVDMSLPPEEQNEAELLGVILTAQPVKLTDDGHRDIFTNDFDWVSPTKHYTAAEFAALHGVDISDYEE